jgi:hypothetical protein
MATVSLIGVDGQPLTSAVLSSAAGGDITGVAATAAKFTRVYKIFLVVTGATVITFKDGTTALSGAMSLPANGAIILDLDGQPWFVTSKNSAFFINSSAATQVSGTIYYTQTTYPYI